MYWDVVLKEVLNKEDLSYKFVFTNVRDYKIHLKEPVVEYTVKKNEERKRGKKHNLGLRHPGIYFTEREAQTIEHFLCGRTTTEVACILGLSRRTIEFYLKNMKAKLNCRFKPELIKEVLSSNFTLPSSQEIDSTLKK